MNTKNKRFELYIAVVVLLICLACGAQAASPLTEEPAPSPTAVGQTYKIMSITTLTTNGGRVAWSQDGEWIYFDRLEADGFWDVYRVHPDGSGETCLTCDAPELPNKNQGQPEAHPGGRYLLFQVEKAEHAGKEGQWVTNPGGGIFNDLWVLDLETGDFYQLTDVRSAIPASGSLHAHFNHDGTKLLWGDYEGPGGRFADWQLAVADFVTTPTPHLENHQYYNPGPQPTWMETHGWGPDGSWIYFTCTPVAGMHDNDMDICRMDFDNPTDVTRLTFTSGLNGEPGEWDEHAHLSPAGDVFSWMSSAPYGTEAGEDYGRWLRTELWLMNADGSSPQRITSFNDTEHATGADQAWNPAAPDNPQLALTVRLADRDEVHIKIVELSKEE